MSDGVYDIFAVGSGSNGHGIACKAVKADGGRRLRGMTWEDLGLSLSETSMSRECIAAVVG